MAARVSLVTSEHSKCNDSLMAAPRRLPEGLRSCSELSAQRENPTRQHGRHPCQLLSRVARPLPAQDQRQHARLVAEADQHTRNVQERDAYVRSIAAKVGVAVSGALRPVPVLHPYSIMNALPLCQTQRCSA